MINNTTTITIKTNSGDEISIIRCGQFKNEELAFEEIVNDIIYGEGFNMYEWFLKYKDEDEIEFDVDLPFKAESKSSSMCVKINGLELDCQVTYKGINKIAFKYEND